MIDWEADRQLAYYGSTNQLSCLARPDMAACNTWQPVGVVSGQWLHVAVACLQEHPLQRQQVLQCKMLCPFVSLPGNNAAVTWAL